jgi:hypothetical protein
MRHPFDFGSISIPKGVSAYASKVCSRLAAAVVAAVLAPAIWKATLPPNGPALLLLATFKRQKLLCPLVASVPVQVVPAGILTVNF